jgi:predicted nucleic acid-binding protein
MPIVIDSSAILALALDDEEATLAEAAVAAVLTESGQAPGLLWYEVRNALIVNERRGRITSEEALAFLAEIDALPISLDFPPPNDAVLNLARQHALSVYDAVYLELTLRSGALIATLDEALRAAVKAAGGKLFGE